MALFKLLLLIIFPSMKMVPLMSELSFFFKFIPISHNFSLLSVIFIIFSNILEVILSLFIWKDPLPMITVFREVLNNK